ncbi:MAG: hypothetical protein ABJA66_18340 [Actinomycetota bacterium]
MKIITENMDEDILLNSNEDTFLTTQIGLKTILCGGLTVGILDGLFALVYYGLILGAETTRIFQSVAAGLLGKDSFEGGTPTFLLGILLHFVVAICIAAVYWIASLKLQFLIRRAVVCGLIYGMIAYLVMNYVVIPLSNTVSGKFSLMNFTVAIIGQALLVGLPIALITREFSRSKK